MNFDRNPGSLLLSGSVLVMALLALGGCSGGNNNNAADSVAQPSASVASNAADPAMDPAMANSAAAMKGENDDEEAEMERHHKQEMDHADMRMGGMKPDSDQQNDSQPAPMTDM